MPRTRSLAWSELKIGVLTIVAVVIAATTIFMLTGGRGFFWQRYNLKTRFDNVAGLKSGSPVRVAGVEVGIVTSVDDFVGEQVDVADLEVHALLEEHEAAAVRIRVGGSGIEHHHGSGSFVCALVGVRERVSENENAVVGPVGHSTAPAPASRGQAAGWGDIT